MPVTLARHDKLLWELEGTGRRHTSPRVATVSGALQAVRSLATSRLGRGLAWLTLPPDWMRQRAHQYPLSLYLSVTLSSPRHSIRWTTYHCRGAQSGSL